MKISTQQPMRPAEIELVAQTNENTEGLANEVTARTGADTTLQNNIDTEKNERVAADNTLQSNINTVDAKFPIQTDNIGDLQVTNAKLAASAVSTDRVQDAAITTAKLESDVQEQLTFLSTIPEFEFGTSNSFNVSGSSYQDVDVTFTTKTEEPIVLCGLQHATGSLACVVTAVTNQQFSARVHNLSTTDVENVTLDWLTISGR